MGLLIGLCGSLTSFSSWMFSVFSELANYHSYNRSVGQSFVSGLMDIIAILFLSFGSYYFGSHLMKRYHKYHPPIEGAWFTNHVALKPKVWEWTFLGSAIGLWALMILLSVLTSINKSLWLSGSLAPLGTWTRFLLSSLFNNRNPYFPYGTFLANVSGSSLISILYILSFNSSMTGCVWIVAAQSGFCGCLTTVSTLMVELHFLKFKYAWRYGALSISAGLLSIIIVFGSFMWSSGVDMSNSMCLNV